MVNTNTNILNSSDITAVINTLVQALAYVQEVTIVGKIDEHDLASPIVPKYSQKQVVITGEARVAAEKKLLDYINIL